MAPTRRSKSRRRHPYDPGHVPPELESLRWQAPSPPIARQVDFWTTDSEDMPPAWATELANEPYSEQVLGKFLAMDAGDWWVSGSLVLVDGQLSITRLVVEPNIFRYPEGSPRPGGIGSRDLRRIRVAELLAEIRSRILRYKDDSEILDRLVPDRLRQPAAEEAARAAAKAIKAASLKRGRKGFPDEFYRGIALEYLDLQEQGYSRGILNELARKHKRPRETIRDWVHQARRRGFLTSGERGKAGADPGPRLFASDAPLEQPGSHREARQQSERAWPNPAPKPSKGRTRRR